jgi:hypothetical protein
MTGTGARTWTEANQACLSAWLAVVRDALEGRSAAADKRRTAEAASREMPQPAAIDVLCSSFGLSLFEREVLLLAAASELDATQSKTAHPTFGMALAALDDPHWSAITPVAPLRRWRLIELLDPASVTTSRLRVDETILHFLAGIAYTDERVAALIDPVAADPDLAPAHQKLAEAAAHGLSRTEPLPVVELCGSDPASRRAVAAAACETLGLKLCAIQAAQLSPPAHELETLMRLWEREAALTGSALLVECEGTETPGAVSRFVDHISGALLISSRERRTLGTRRVIALEVPRLTAAERRRQWFLSLGPAAVSINGNIEALASHFAIGVPAIRSASAQVRATTPDASGTELAAQLWDACRDLARPRLGDLAQRIEAVASWEDLVLPERQIGILREIAIHARNQAAVYERWGFAAKSARGLGISALFAGASGTGKTMAAEVLAKDLNLDLYRIDLSAVVSKYIGETEKNLARIFDAAEEGGSILLFDEADALFGKRSEVKDSHDRYANIEISYLLQRMEAYRGLAILTTNMKSALDQAFVRRLRFTVDFPFPGPAERREIWRRVFPAETPTEALDFTKLAQLNVSGGHIRNIALGAAFLAVHDGSSVGMPHLLRAARSEAAKLESTLSEVEVAGWV